MRFSCSAASAGLVVLAVVSLQTAHAQKPQPANHTLDMTVVKPETVGFSGERLERLHALIQDEIDGKHLGGVSHLRPEGHC
jgi:hypothetical protein